MLPPALAVSPSDFAASGAPPGSDSRYLQPRNDGHGAAVSLGFQKTSPDRGKYPRQRPWEATKSRFVQPGVKRVGTRRVFQVATARPCTRPSSSLSAKTSWGMTTARSIGRSSDLRGGLSVVVWTLSK